MIRRFRRQQQEPYRVSLTSLMDIVTNILVYTIKIFAVSPILIQDPAVELPRSTSQKDAEDTVVVMVTGIRPEETPTIMVDGRVVNKIDPKAYRVPENAKHNGYIIGNLKNELLRIKEIQAQSANLVHKGGFTGKVAIVADKFTPYRVLVDVLATCGDAGFGSFEFAVIKQEA